MKVPTLVDRLRLILITDDRGREPRELAGIVQAAVSGGVTCVQLREKSAPGHMCLDYLARLQEVCLGGQVPLMVNADLMNRIPSDETLDGIHYSSRTFGIQVFPRPLLTGYSAHSPEEAETIMGRGADFVTISPIFATSSKPGNPGEGTRLVSQTRSLCPGFPIVALGGIDRNNASPVIQAGANGVAVISAIMTSSDPYSEARRLREMIEFGLNG